MSNVREMPRRSRVHAWWPAILAVAVICVESTNGMGLRHTNDMLAGAVRWSGHQATEVDPFNRLFRKLGHFTGYGLLGVCFARGWLRSGRAHRAWKTAYVHAGLQGVASAFFFLICVDLI